MTTVQTVTGPVDGADLGRTLVHEHIRISYAGEELDPTYSWDRADTVERAVDKMGGAARRGVPHLRRPVPHRARAATPSSTPRSPSRSGMRSCARPASTPSTADSGLPFYWRARDPEEMAELYVQELQRRHRRHRRHPGRRDQGGDRHRGHARRARCSRGAALAQREVGVRHHHAHRELAARRRATGPLRRRRRRPRTRPHRSPGRADRRRADPQARRARHVRRASTVSGSRSWRPTSGAPTTWPRSCARASPPGVPVAGPHLRADRAARAFYVPPEHRAARPSARGDRVAGVAASVHLHPHRLRAPTARARRHRRRHRHDVRRQSPPTARRDLTGAGRRSLASGPGIIALGSFASL